VSSGPDSTVRTARLEGERERLRAKRLASPIRSPDGPNAAMLAKGPAFESLEACLRHLRATYPQSATDVAARDIAGIDDGPLVGGATMPAFMFRGESGIYPSTQTSLARLTGALDLSPETIETLVALSILVRGRLSDYLGLSVREAGGFLQHYGAPTDLFDVSPDLDVAIEFATNLAPGDWGVIAVLPVSALSADPDGFMLADLTRHRLASRPRRQTAYVYADHRYLDLKSPAASEHRQIVWHWFRFTAKDEAAYAPNPYRLDARSDGVAGLIQVFLNDTAPFDDAAAAWLADRIPAVPLVMRVLGEADGHRTFSLLAADDASPELFEASAAANRARWAASSARSRAGAADRDPGVATALDTAELVVGPGGFSPGELVWALRGTALQHARLPG